MAHPDRLVEARRIADSQRQLTEFRQGWAENLPAGRDTEPHAIAEPPPTGRRRPVDCQQPPPRTRGEMVLAAARKCAQPFGMTALILTAWRLYPREFGLAGCEEQHPDARRIAEQVYGRRGLVRTERLRALEGPDGTALFEVTR